MVSDLLVLWNEVLTKNCQWGRPGQNDTRGKIKQRDFSKMMPYLTLTECARKFRRYQLFYECKKCGRYIF